MPKIVSPIDVEIGQALRALRTVKGVSQTALGEALGITFQQIQKYESGKNRLSVSSLIRVCKALSVAPMDVIGSQFDQPSDLTDLSTEIARLRDRLARIRSIAGE